MGQEGEVGHCGTGDFQHALSLSQDRGRLQHFETCEEIKNVAQRPIHTGHELKFVQN